jgi:hypothetical protein
MREEVYSNSNYAIGRQLQLDGALSQGQYPELNRRRWVKLQKEIGYVQSSAYRVLSTIAT